MPAVGMMLEQSRTVTLPRARLLLVALAVIATLFAALVSTGAAAAAASSHDASRHVVPVDNDRERNVWERAVETMLDPEADVRDRSNAMRRLLVDGAERAEPRRLIARRLLDASQSRADLVRILDELAYYAEDEEFRGHFRPEYFFSLLLIAERDAPDAEQRDDDLRERAHAIVVAGYAAQIRRDLLLAALRLNIEATPRNHQVVLAAIRAMSHPTLTDLSTQIDAFCPALIERINAEPAPPRDAAAQAQATLRAITEYREASTPSEWRDWWQRTMAELSSLERVEQVVENVRRHRSALERELSVLRVAEQQRAVEENAENFEELLRFVDLERHPDVVRTALEHLRAWLETRSANEEQEAALMSRLAPCFASPLAEVRAALAHTAILLGSAGEALVAERTALESAPSAKAAMISLLARHGSDAASLGIVLDVLVRREDLSEQVVLAAIRNVPRWSAFDEETEAATVETLVTFAQGLSPRRDQGLAVELHNALNELSQRLDVTAVVRVLLHSPAASGPSAMSLQLQLAIVRHALSGPSRESLAALMREYERETHYLFHVLSRAEPSRFELLRSLEILTELEDPFLDLERRNEGQPSNGRGEPTTLYEAIARHHRGRENRETVHTAIAETFRAFAISEMESYVQAGAPSEPPLAVLTRMMALELASLARSDTLPALRRAFSSVVEEHETVFERLNARLGIRMVTAMSEALPEYARLVRDARIPEAIQHEDLDFALSRGTTQQVEFRLLLLPRLILALHPQGPGTPVNHVWERVAAKLAQRLTTGERPQAQQHVLRAARAMYEHSDELRRLLEVEGNRHLQRFHDAVGDARRTLEAFQSERWNQLAGRLQRDEPVSSDIRRFVRDTSVGLPAVGTRFAEVPSNTQVAMPSLVDRLYALDHGDRLTRSLWTLITEAAAGEGHQLTTNWPESAEAFAGARAALTEELSRAGYDVRNP